MGRDIDVNRSEAAVLAKVGDRLVEERSPAPFTVDLSEFTADVDALLADLENRRRIEEEFRARRLDVRTQLHVLDEQIRITQGALGETRADFDFAATEVDDVVDCPMCGATYANTFAERFAIASDEQRLLDLLAELQRARDSVLTKLEELDHQFTAARLDAEAMDQALQQSRANVTLQDAIVAEGSREALRMIRRDAEQRDSAANELQRKLKQTRAEMKAMRDKDREGAVRSHYQTVTTQFLSELNVSQYAGSGVMEFTAKINETGSELPRALMAAYYGFLHTIARFSTSTFCPIVVDEPNQQGQDRENLPRFIEFIFARQPENSQLVLGLEDLHGVDPRDAAIIELHDRDHVLREDEFDDVAGFINPLFEASLRGRGL